MKIDDIYKELKILNLCKSAHDFSENHLKRHRSYLSVLKARESIPSIEVWAILSYTLNVKINVISKSNNNTVQLTVQRLRLLQQKVTENIMQECAARSL